MHQFIDLLREKHEKSNQQKEKSVEMKKRVFSFLKGLQFHLIYKVTLGKKVRANGGCLGYPEAKKDVVSCEKSRGSANRI